MDRAKANLYITYEGAEVLFPNVEMGLGETLMEHVGVHPSRIKAVVINIIVEGPPPQEGPSAEGEGEEEA
ncbi:hypothetical protein [Methylobacter sp.]|uniref:hypothetical protein n=1 Tax=Methylobacter sp. TaxID=2051955 RepID=UPI00121A8283|nr:hypothetical protein [Methylobacter sp.]TAK59550.1 MAG: hypothetical protein EPO18_20525 [Methylobacter sp.]